MIFVPEARLYLQGFEVECSDPEGTWTPEWDPDRELLSVVHDPGMDEHTIRVVPADGPGYR